VTSCVNKSVWRRPAMSFVEEDLTINGHAIAVRINAAKLPILAPAGKATQYHAPAVWGCGWIAALYDGYKNSPITTA